MGMFLILIVFAAIGILGAVYAPEIRKSIDTRSRNWKSRWDAVEKELHQNEEADKKIDTDEEFNNK